MGNQIYSDLIEDRMASPHELTRPSPPQGEKRMADCTKVKIL